MTEKYSGAKDVPDGIACWKCDRQITPAVVVRDGCADHSVCPFCGARIQEFTLLGRFATLIGEQVGRAVSPFLYDAVRVARDKPWLLVAFIAFLIVMLLGVG